MRRIPCSSCHLDLHVWRTASLLTTHWRWISAGRFEFDIYLSITVALVSVLVTFNIWLFASTVCFQPCHLTCTFHSCRSIQSRKSNLVLRSNCLNALFTIFRRNLWLCTVRLCDWLLMPFYCGLFTYSSTTLNFLGWLGSLREVLVVVESQGVTSLNSTLKYSNINGGSMIADVS